MPHRFNLAHSVARASASFEYHETGLKARHKSTKLFSRKLLSKEEFSRFSGTVNLGNAFRQVHTDHNILHRPSSP